MASKNTKEGYRIKNWLRRTRLIETDRLKIKPIVFFGEKRVQLNLVIRGTFGALFLSVVERCPLYGGLIF